jgi:hypothetical protein
MKKTMTILSALIFATSLLISCGGNSNNPKWDKVAEEKGLSKDDVKKAIEIGTKMADCFKIESAPGKMDSEMTAACDPFMKEYIDYCIEKFGTDDFLGDSPNVKKVDGFRQIMFGTRNELAEAKQKK